MLKSDQYLIFFSKIFLENVSSIQLVAGRTAPMLLLTEVRFGPLFLQLWVLEPNLRRKII